MFGNSKIAELKLELQHANYKINLLEEFRDKVTNAYIWQGAYSYTPAEWAEIERNPGRKVLLGTKHMIPVIIDVTYRR